MTVLSVPMTVAEFDQFILLPEHSDATFEFIVGEMYQKMPSNAYSSEIAFRIGRLVGNFIADNDLGRATGEGGGYQIGAGERYAPDFAFVSKERQAELTRKGYNSIPPDLAIEVEYPTSAESEKRLRYKIMNYLQAGTVVWVVYPETKTIEIYTPNQSVQFLSETDTLTGGDILKGFSLPVSDIFK